MNDLLTTLAFNDGPLRLGLLVLMALGLVGAVIFYRIDLPAIRRRRRLAREQAATNRFRREAPAKKGRFGKTKANDADTEEFIVAVGMTPTKYLQRSLVIALIGVAVSLVVLGSWAMAIVSALGSLVYRNAAVNGKLAKARDETIINEVTDLARALAETTARSTLREALASRVAIGDNPTSLLRALRRAVRSPRTLREGLEEERARVHSTILLEFYEILIEGTSADRGLTVQTLIAFAAVQTSKKAAYRKRDTLTAAAKGQRKMLLGMIPALFTLTAWQSGFDSVLHTMPGNIIIMVLFGLLIMAYWLTNKVIASATEGF